MDTENSTHLEHREHPTIKIDESAKELKKPPMENENSTKASQEANVNDTNEILAECKEEQDKKQTNRGNSTQPNDGEILIKENEQHYGCAISQIKQTCKSTDGKPPITAKSSSNQDLDKTKELRSNSGRDEKQQTLTKRRNSLPNPNLISNIKGQNTRQSIITNTSVKKTNTKAKINDAHDANQPTITQSLRPRRSSVKMESEMNK